MASIRTAPSPALLDSVPRSGARRVTFAAVAGVAALSAAALLLAVGEPIFAGAFFAGLLGVGAIIFLRTRLTAPVAAWEIRAPPDIALLRAALDTSAAAA